MSNICIDCKKSVGLCPWSACDPVTKKLLFQPVPGWTATPTKLKVYKGRMEASYNITACPLFEPDTRSKSVREPGVCELCGKPLAPGSARKRYCYDCVPKGKMYSKAYKKVYDNGMYKRDDK